MKTRVAAAMVVLAASIFAGCAPARAAGAFPDPAVDNPLAPAGRQETAVFAGGCFWGIESVFEHVNGVIDAVSGYSGGSARTASYEIVGTGSTGHAESVKVTYDPSKVSYGVLLKVFFAVGHDPTQLNRQGPDTGTQYRSVIFTSGASQQKIATSYIAQLDAAKQFRNRIVTQVVPLEAFYPAETYHQNYADHHPNDLYIMVNDRPKVYALRREYPGLYNESR
jgi:peptide-methionine (S)-S-oxide reductase